jgi:hypothetical protein
MSGQVLEGDLGRSVAYQVCCEVKLTKGYAPSKSELNGFSLKGLTPDTFTEGLEYFALHKGENLIGLLGYETYSINSNKPPSYWAGLVEIKEGERNNGYGRLLLTTFLKHASDSGAGYVSGEIMNVSYKTISKFLNQLKEEGIIKEFNSSDPFGDYAFSDRAPVSIWLK